MPAGKNPPFSPSVLHRPPSLHLLSLSSSPSFLLLHTALPAVLLRARTCIHALEQQLQQSQQVTETVYVPISLVGCNNLLWIVSPSPKLGPSTFVFFDGIFCWKPFFCVKYKLHRIHPIGILLKRSTSVR